MEVEKLKKKQAVNKLAEIVQRKPANKENKGNNEDVKKREKENRKLQAELKQVCMVLVHSVIQTYLAWYADMLVTFMTC